MTRSQRLGSVTKKMRTNISENAHEERLSDQRRVQQPRSCLPVHEYQEAGSQRRRGVPRGKELTRGARRIHRPLLLRRAAH